ncbi:MULTISPECIES: acyl-CoA thioesterase [unclassified Streptomyces]|uniref:acyl-CoA thioesterase n=1 Tax=unclassified Streptomyces TaxID=2593676 RepID=UPI003BB603BA
MAEQFSVPVEVRGYEIDVNGHLNQAVYLQYAEHARWSFLRHAGLDENALLGRGVGPVVLETNIRYLRELRAGDVVDVSCAFEFGDGKVFRVHQTLRRADGSVAAEVTAVSGVMDLTERKLVKNPGEIFKELASAPAVLGL